MRRLAGSLVSWLTFQQAALRSKMYKEYWMYAPIYEVAAAREWDIEPQQHFRHNTKNKYIDFIFYGIDQKKYDEGDRVAAVEVSYIRTGSPVAKINDDFEKLRNFKSFKSRKYGGIKRYIIIAAKKDVLEKYCKSHFRTASPLFTKNPPKKLGSIYHSPIPEYRSRWCVMVLCVQPSRPGKHRRPPRFAGRT